MRQISNRANCWGAQVNFPKSKCVVLVVVLSVLTGCHHLHTHAELKGAIPMPAGTYSDQWHELHASAGEQQRLIVNLASWIGESDRLGPKATGRMKSLVDSGLPDPITIEASGNWNLDQQRQQGLSRLLFDLGFEVPPESLKIVDQTTSSTLHPDEAEIIVGNMTGLPSQSSSDQGRFGGTPNLSGFNTF